MRPYARPRSNRSSGVRGAVVARPGESLLHCFDRAHAFAAGAKGKRIARPWKRSPGSCTRCVATRAADSAQTAPGEGFQHSANHRSSQPNASAPRRCRRCDNLRGRQSDPQSLGECGFGATAAPIDRDDPRPTSDRPAGFGKQADELRQGSNAPRASTRLALRQPSRSASRGVRWRMTRSSTVGCRGGDSNPYALVGPRILSPLRLPFRHSGAGANEYTEPRFRPLAGTSQRAPARRRGARARSARAGPAPG